ncbi:hypothetical protein [Chitinimonas lacunae]|uniref:DUF4142 domain-containing protein n=1 Tax=Chitinimonas lacunae TaxID=1963018 RepID=A0ABV8MT75_9NEIS
MPLTARTLLALSLALPATYAADTAKEPAKAPFPAESKVAFDVALHAWQFEQVRDMAELMDKTCRQHASTAVSSQASAEKQAMIDVLEKQYPGIQSRIKDIRSHTPDNINALIASQSRGMFDPFKEFLAKMANDKQLSDKMCTEFAASWKKDTVAANDLFGLSPQQFSQMHTIDMADFRSKVVKIDLPTALPGKKAKP